MPATLAELAALVGGEFQGPGNLVLNGAAPLSDAGPGDITLVDRTDRVTRLENSSAAAVVVPKGTGGIALPSITVDDPHRAFAEIIVHFRPPRQAWQVGVHASACVSPRARLAESVNVHAHATIEEDVTIGEGTTIHSGVRIMPGCRIGCEVVIFPNAVLYENTILGDRCIVHGGAVLGAYGFGYCCQDGRHVLAAQLGNVIVEDDVEIGANSTIDRGTYGPTVIGEGTKIDNEVMIAHNCRIGRHNMICAQVGIAGSSTTGDYVVMAGQVGVRDHVHIGEGAVLGAMAGVINDVPAGARVVGIPATPEREQMLKQAALTKLPDMRRQLKQLQDAVRRMTEPKDAVEAQR